MTLSHFSYMEKQITAIKSASYTQELSKRLFDELLMDVQDPYHEVPRSSTLSDQDSAVSPVPVPQKSGLTGLDLYYIPHLIDDHDLVYLDGLLGKNRRLISIDHASGKRIISQDGYTKLNYFLDMAAKHSLKHGMGIAFFRTTLKDWCHTKWDKRDKKEKVFFHITSQEEYEALVSFLTSGQQEQKSGLFLKNLICFSDLDNNEVYQNRRTLFQYLITDVFSKLFDEDIPITVKTNTRYKEHNHSIDHRFRMQIGEEKLNLRLLGNIKGQNSLLDKNRRSREYSSVDAINDMIRFQIVCDTHQQLVNTLCYFIAFYQQHGGEYFLPDPLLEKIQIKDKGLINSTRHAYRERVGTIENDLIRGFVAQALQQKDIKGEKGYKDTKLLVPVTMKGKLFTIEVKFVLGNRQETNERGLNRHEVLKLKQKIELRCRDQKFLSAERIRWQCKQLVEKECPAIMEDIAPENNEEAVDILYDHVISDTQLLQETTLGDQLLIHKKLFKVLSANRYFPTLP